MSNEIQAQTTSKKVVDVIENGKRKRVYKSEFSIYVRTTEALLKAVEEKHNLTGLSKSSIASLCIINQLGNLPNFKVENIDVFYLEDGEKKKLTFNGNTLNKVSNFKKGETK